MPTTFNWISLGTPRNATGGIVTVDPSEIIAGAENASSLLTAASGSGPRVFGSQGAPLYNSITSATMINRSGSDNALDTDTAVGTSADRFTTNIGAGVQTFNFDALVNYNGTVTYADGSTASNVTLLVVQAETGELFLAPPPATGSNAALTLKPIQSIRLDSVANNDVNLLIDRQLGIFDDGFVDGTAGADLIGPSYVEPAAGGSDRIDGNDGLTSAGTNFNDDRIRAGAGNDTIDGGLGNDLIDAGEGNDLVNLTGTFGNDTITGGAGSDTLSGATLTGASTVTFNGGSGTFASGGSTASFNTIEAVTTGSGADTVTISGAVAGSFATGAGADTITAGGSGADTINTGEGDDLVNLTGTFGSDTITGGAGSDTLSGATLTGPSTVTFTNGNGTFANGGSTASFNTIEAITTGAGADTVNAATNTSAASFALGAGNDSFTGGLGAETIDGGAGDDTIVSGGGADVVNAGDGQDLVDAGEGNDYVDAGAGNDTVAGGAGNDTLLGGTGDDQLSGGSGDDSLLGGAGNDVLLGGDGNDYLDGGPGADTLTGGAGNDVFVVSNGDLITDFTTGDPANNDSVDLTAFYNDDNLAIINAQRVSAGLTPYNSALGWLRADQADDGVLNSIRTDAGFAENVTLRIQNGGTAVTAAQLTEGSTSVLCFGSDALIQTVDGPVPAGALKVGDMVMTRDNGAQPIRWIGQRVIDAAALADRPALAPIRIRAGALGQALPSSDLIVSPQHRILVRSKIATRMVGAPEVLVAAKQLMAADGIDVADDLAEVTYVHFLFDDHQIVLSNGAETESLHTGQEALKAVPVEARAEILALFPDLADGTSRAAVRPMLTGRLGRKLAERHARNRKALVA
ncbi:Hint domain-containing protein [uncultured Paracoccus sp.]|uniref:Hint domain-containing protein n=1 Tax=uncultured Paracoccus sp. TaxID=189685 RepID=UPI0030DAF99B